MKTFLTLLIFLGSATFAQPITFNSNLQKTTTFATKKITTTHNEITISLENTVLSLSTGGKALLRKGHYVSKGHLKFTDFF